jgi:hypothetical protein
MQIKYMKPPTYTSPRLSGLSTSAARILFPLVLLLAASPARGQFGRVTNQPFSGSVTVINEYTRADTVAVNSRDNLQAERDRKGGMLLEKRDQVLTRPAAGTAPVKAGNSKRVTRDLAPIIMQSYEETRADMEARAPAFFNERAIGADRGEKSFRMSKTRLHLSSSPQLFTGFDGRGFTLRAFVPGNRASTYIRTPTGFSEDLDPGFEAQFDLELIVDVAIQGSRLVASPARVKLNVQPPRGKNLTGNAALISASWIKELGGPDWIGQLTRIVNGREFPVESAITKALAEFSPILAQAGGKGAILPGYDSATRNITLTVTAPGKEPVVR